MATANPSIQQRALTQQGYLYSPNELTELSWGLRFTPAVCMLLAVYGLATQQPWIHFSLAVLGTLPFWFPTWHPFDRLYNHLLRPLWNGVELPPNPLPRRIACFMGGAMNVGIGFAFVTGHPPVAYGLGAALITLQLIVITTHFCVASWMFEGLLRLAGRWNPTITVEQAKEILEAGGQLVDVREPDEFARSHLPQAVNIPLDDLEQHLDRLRASPAVLYCQSGLRSQRAMQLLRERGIERVFNLGALPSAASAFVDSDYSNSTPVARWQSPQVESRRP